jgi:hypothetical protein
MRSAHHHVGQRRQCARVRQARGQAPHAPAPATPAHGPARGPAPAARHRWACRWQHPCRRSFPAWPSRRDIQDIVHHLKRQTQRRAVVCQRHGAAAVDTPQATPIITLACSNAPVLRRCMWRNWSSSAPAPRWPGQSPARPPCRRARGAGQLAAQRACTAGNVFILGCEQLEGKRLQASPASKACASPNCTCTVGLPRRSTSLSMHGMSSCTSE